MNETFNPFASWVIFDEVRPGFRNGWFRRWWLYGSERYV